MAFIQSSFFSRSLQIVVSMNVILPEFGREEESEQFNYEDRKYPVLYLLHGLSDDHTAWVRNTSIERYVSETGIAVVMPAVGRSFYTDMNSGPKYWSFISKELPAVARAYFPLSDKREENFVAGLSMGGYGAMKLALSCPDKFAAGASLSGALDIVDIGERGEFSEEEYAGIFGSAAAARNSGNDLFHMAEKLAEGNGPVPMLYQCCGTEDFLYEMNQDFLKHVRNLGLEITYEEEPGTHVWSYWDKKIQRVLEWLPLNKNV